jgi:predicted phage terminase large subunit-like protein
VTNPLLEELIARQEALTHLEGFRQYMSRSGHPDVTYPHERHHKLIIEKLEALERGDIRRLVIAMPPGSAKSTVANVQFVPWYAAKHPDDQIIAVSATQALAEAFNRRKRALIQTPQWEMLAETTINVDQQSVANFGYGMKGNQLALGVGSSVIGRRADLIVIDDYCASFEEISNENRREQIFVWFQNELKSRLIPKTGKILVIGTIWSNDDLISRITRGAEADTWTYLRLPMLADSDDDPMGRKIGEPLWPAWYEQSMIDEVQRDARTFSCMYQQRPLLDDGQWLSLDDIEIVNTYPDNMSMYASTDIALTEGGKSDYTVILTAGVTNDRKLIIVDMYRARITPDKIIEQLINVYQRWKPKEVLIDDDNASKTLKALAHEILRQKGIPLPLKSIPMKGQNKEVRASPLRGLALQGGVKLLKGSWNSDFLREVETFPRTGSNIHDDIIDAAGLLATRMGAMSSGTIVKAPEPEKKGYCLDDLWKHNEEGWKSKVIRL